MMKTIRTHPYAAALAGLLFTLPFAALNYAVSSRFEPVLSILRPGARSGPLEYSLLLITLLLLPVGAYVAARPMLQAGEGGKRPFSLLNALIAALLLAAFVIIIAALGAEIYRCDVLLILNCD